jgi:hypothetical protein
MPCVLVLCNTTSRAKCGMVVGAAICKSAVKQLPAPATRAACSSAAKPCEVWRQDLGTRDTRPESPVATSEPVGSHQSHRPQWWVFVEGTSHCTLYSGAWGCLVCQNCRMSEYQVVGQYFVSTFHIKRLYDCFLSHMPSLIDKTLGMWDSACLSRFFIF